MGHASLRINRRHFTVDMVGCAPEAVDEAIMSGASTNDRSNVVHHIMPNASIS